DGIRVCHVTGVQTCALPISSVGGGLACHSASARARRAWRLSDVFDTVAQVQGPVFGVAGRPRSPRGGRLGPFPAFTALSASPCGIHPRRDEHVDDTCHAADRPACPHRKAAPMTQAFRTLPFFHASALGRSPSPAARPCVPPSVASLAAGSFAINRRTLPLLMALVTLSR